MPIIGLKNRLKPIIDSISFAILRQSMFSLQRKWTIVDKGKCSSAIEFNYDTLWIPRYCKIEESQAICSRMKRIKTDGTHQDLFELKSSSAIRDVVMYDLPDPVFETSMPAYEYRPTLCVLRKNNVLSRYDLLNGTLYDFYHLGSSIFKEMSWNASLDQLILSTNKLKNSIYGYSFVGFKIFKLHPFKVLSSFVIRDNIFPSRKDVKTFGKLKSAEIEGSFLLISTFKNYILCYNLEDILKETEKTHDNTSTQNTDKLNLVEKSSPVLFASHAHLNVLSFGGHPWMYIRSVNNALLEIRNLETGNLIRGGEIRLKKNKLIPDNLTFHMDDSNRVIHFNNSEIRVLRIKNESGNTYIQEEFNYNEQNIARSEVPKTSLLTTTRKGRVIKRQISEDLVSNHVLAFGLENDLKILYILESNSDSVYGVELSKVTFFDSDTFQVLHELNIGVLEGGNIETNNFMILMDKDVINIVTKIGSVHSYLSFRLTYKRGSELKHKNDLKCVNKVKKESSPDRQFFGPDVYETFDSNYHMNRVNLNNVRSRNRHFNFDSDEEWNP